MPKGKMWSLALVFGGEKEGGEHRAVCCDNFGVDEYNECGGESILGYRWAVDCMNERWTVEAGPSGWGLILLPLNVPSMKWCSARLILINMKSH